MPTTEKRHLLKVFSGPHLGAEVLLGDGACVIGTDDSSDVIFSDQLIASRHARLTISGDSVVCEALEGATVVVDGKPIDSQPLEAFQYFTLGNTHLAIGLADAKWPITEFPDYQLHVTTAVGEEDQSEPAQSEETTDTTANNPADGESVVVEETGEARAPRARRPRAIAAALAALFFLPLLMLLLLLTLTAGSEPPKQVDREALRRELQAVVRRHNYNDSIQITERRGKIIAEGYVPTAEERGVMTDALGAVLSDTFGGVERRRVRLWDTDSLVTATQDVVRMHEWPVEARAGEPGEVVLEGELPDADSHRKLLDRVAEDVPRIGQLTDQTTLGPDEIDIVLPVPERPAAASSEPRVAAVKTQPEPETAPRLPPIHGINIGNTRSITLADGKRLYRGAELANGYIVTQIDSDRVVLSKGDAQAVVTIGI